MNCGLALILLLDVSGSIGPDDFARQREGHAAALRSPAITRAAEQDGIAIAAIQYDADSYPAMQWRVLRSAADATAAAEHLAGMDRLGATNTYTGSAVMDALAALDNAPCGDVRIVDVVTDGKANGGTPLPTARDAAQDAGVRVNVLIVGGDDEDADDMRDRLATRDGFVMRVSGWEEFATAVRKKVVLEVGAR
jgi:hypothetical protein